MTAVSSTSRKPTSNRFVSRGALVVLAIVLAASSALFAMTRLVVSQNSGAAIDGTPTAERLQTLRSEAIADGADQLELELQQFNDSGIEGTVTLYDLGDQTLVAILIEGGGDAHPAHIHAGTCDDLEPEPFAPLGTVHNEEDSLALVDASLPDLIDGDYSVDLHLSPNELGTLIACVDIDGEPAPATPVVGATPGTPEPTGAPAPTTVPEPTQGIVEETPEPTATEPAATREPTVTPIATEEATPADTSEDGTGGAEAAPDSVASLPLTDYSGLGVTGTVTLIALDADTTKVTIRLHGDAVTGGHIAHLHPGTCNDPQDDGTIYLATVDANGVSDSTVNLPMTNLLNQAWVVNVHESDANYDTWLVCGFLGNATIGMSGGAEIPADIGGQTVVSGKGEPITGKDGTAGLGGQTGDRQATTLPQTAGVGSSIIWPDSPTPSIIWALASFALILATCAAIVLRADRTNRQPSRWNRLGL